MHFITVHFTNTADAQYLRFLAKKYTQLVYFTMTHLPTNLPSIPFGIIHQEVLVFYFTRVHSMNSVDVQYLRIFCQKVYVTSSLNYDLPSIRCYPSSQLLPTEWALFITADGQVDNMVPVGARVVTFTRTVQRHVQFNVSVKLQFCKHRRGRQR